MKREGPPPVLVLCGPTAVGKTSVAVEMAQTLNTEIVSFDSRQFYRELRIGAAPPDEEQLLLARHHFIADRSIASPLSAGQYAQEARPVLEEIIQRTGTAILVGGSGLYLKALLQGLDEMPEVPEQVRQHLREDYASRGLKPLQEELRKQDPDYYHQVDLQNPQRILRALEVIRASGAPFSSFRRQSSSSPGFFQPRLAGLNRPREELYKRIHQRIDIMLRDGLLEEVRQLLAYRKSQALQTVGYREMFRYLDKELSWDEALSLLQRNTRRYAKRQITWFKREPELKWFHPNEHSALHHYLSPPC